MAAIAVTQSDLTAMELRVAAGREKDSAASRRMLALAMVLDGADRTSAAKTCGMDRQTLRDWVHRYNAAGLTGLRNRKSSGRPPTLTAAQKAVLVELVEKGPDPARHKVVRWRRCDLADELERLFGVKLHERSVGDLLASLGYRRLSVRPQHLFSTALDIISPPASPCPTTSHLFTSRLTHPNSIPSKTSGNIYAATSSPTRSTKITTISSKKPAKHGCSSPTIRNGSLQSPHANGQR